MTPPRYPLAVDRRHWPEPARAFFDERAGIVEAADRCTRPVAEERAEAITRTWWSSGQG